MTQDDAPGLETQSSRGGSSPGVYNEPNGGSSGGASSDGTGSTRGSVESMAEMVSCVQRFMLKGVPRDKHESQAYLRSYYGATTMDYFIKKLQGLYQNKQGHDTKQKALNEAVEVLPSNTTSLVWLIKGLSVSPHGCSAESWGAGLDLHRDMPVEILHVVLLGFVKYFWRDAVTRVKKAKMQHALEAHLQSCDVQGLGISPPPGHTLVQWGGSLIGRDFRAISQVAPFVLYDFLPAEAVAAWAALAWLVPMIWQPVITDSELHVVHPTPTDHLLLTHILRQL
ncbi:hypothetical protein JB92DRAFT_3121119 [Gautieria morchelliformis]|nr:hypothetical protein JB92DRAFT_3121119 [Gautieria morchelliformis]